MSTQVEETTATEKPAIGADAFSAARESVRTQSEDQGSTETPESESSETPTQEAEKVAGESQEATEDQDALLTPQEVAALPAALKAQYKSLEKAFTTKTQALSAERKALEEWNPLIEGMKTDPAATLEKVAAQLGFKVSKSNQDTKTVESKTAEALAELPEELAFMKPYFESFGKKLLDSMNGVIAPIKAQHEQLITDATAAETKATVEAFTAKYPGWEKHEAKMLDIGQRILPGKGMTDIEYMEVLYREATHGISQAETTKKVVEKINRSAKSSEERTAGVSPERVAHAMPPPEKRGFRDAYEAAKRGEVWEK